MEIPLIFIQGFWLSSTSSLPIFEHKLQLFSFLCLSLTVSNPNRTCKSSQISLMSSLNVVLFLKILNVTVYQSIGSRLSYYFSNKGREEVQTWLPCQTGWNSLRSVDLVGVTVASLTFFFRVLRCPLVLLARIAPNLWWICSVRLANELCKTTSQTMDRQAVVKPASSFNYFFLLEFVHTWLSQA